MRYFLLVIGWVICPLAASGETSDPVIRDILDGHILPRFEALADTSRRLAVAAQGDCNAASAPLRAAYGEAFDAWIMASHLRFGPTEVNDRAFALAFWPDSRGATPRALARLIAEKDGIATLPEAYAHVSIAVRGFYAMEFLLYDQAFAQAGDPEYRCILIQTISADIAAQTAAISEDWQTRYGGVFVTPGTDGVYRTDQDVLQEAYKALATGLQFTSDTRLGRPLGTFERPRPKRAEVRRSGRSARHVMLNLVALRDLARRLANGDTELAATLDRRFDYALRRLKGLNDPVFATVTDPQGRLKVEIVQQSVDDIRAVVRTTLGPALGVAAGFNALDGD